MKFIDCEDLAELTSLIDGIDTGNHILHGRIEAYSCKASGNEKRQTKDLELSLSDQAVALSSPLLTAPSSSTLPATSASLSRGSSVSSASSPVGSSGAGDDDAWRGSLGDIADPAVRKVLITLISTLNASCPDFDFSGAAPADFCTTHAAAALSAIRDHVSESVLARETTALSDAPSFHARVLTALNTHVELGAASSTCDVYEYMCDIETGDEDMAPLWSLNYFFYNRRLKKIVFFTAWATRKPMNSQDADDEDSVMNDSDGRRLSGSRS